MTEATPPPFECVPLPTPYPVGRINTYLLSGSKPGLLDTGVRSDRSLDELQEALEGRGWTFDNLAEIVLTHRHYDHAGAVCEIARRAEAPVLCHADSIRDETRGRQTFLDLITCYGAPRKLRDDLETAWKLGDHYGEAIEDAPKLRQVEDGEKLHVGELELEAVLTPGHCPGHLCFVAAEQGVIFCGDLLLAHITSNPLPHFEESAPRGRRPSLELYMSSLARVEALGPLQGLPGHGKPVADTAHAADAARKHILGRSEKVLRLMRKWPGVNLFGLARKFFWEDNILGQALAFCEILAHADLLESRGHITVDPANGIPEPA